MATNTAFPHPRFAGQMRRFYPHTVDIVEVDGSPVLTGLACRYDAARGGEPAMFEDEAAAADKVLMPSWQPTIAAKQHAIVSIGGLRKRFEVMDVVPHGGQPAQTLLMITPV